MELSDVDKARFDIIARQASEISKALADEVTFATDLQNQQGNIARLKEAYDAYPETVQAEVRKELVPRLAFEFDTGWEDCPHCHRGMVSPDKEEFVEMKDDKGNPVTKEVQQMIVDADGAPVLDDNGQPMTKTVEQVVKKAIAFEKEVCKHCGGSGERRKIATAE